MEPFEMPLLSQLSCQEPCAGQVHSPRGGSGQASQTRPSEHGSPSLRLAAQSLFHPLPHPPHGFSQEGLYPVPHSPGKEQTDLPRFLLNLLWPLGSGL